MRRAMVKAIVSGGALLLASAVSASAQPRYRLVDVGPATYRVCSGPRMNQAGQELAVYYQDGGTTGHTYLIDADGTRTDVGSLFGFDTEGVAIGPAGQIVGHSAVTYENYQNTVHHAFLWTKNAGIRDLSPAGTSATYACDVNAAGDVVGVLDNGHGFVFTGGTTYDVNDLTIDGGGPWANFGFAEGINDSGVIYGIGTLPDGSSHGYLLIPVSSAGGLLANGGFEQSTIPSPAPGWVSDTARQVAAKSETNQPHTGLQNGACWSATSTDCGLYQDLVAPASGSYTFSIFANADREGGYVGVNVNGTTVAWQPVTVNGFGQYASYSMTFSAAQGDAIRVWMYSPTSPGYVIIDDANLVSAP